MVIDGSRPAILREAWRLAREIAATSGQHARSHLAAAQREAWRAARAADRPAPAAVGEIRALMVYGHIPPGHRALPVVDDRNAPHLRAGELAVVDLADCELQHGELFAVAYGRGPAIMQTLWRTWLGEANWWCVQINRPKGDAEMAAWSRAGRAIPSSDGPYAPGGLESIVLGRVVGVLVPFGAEAVHV